MIPGTLTFEASDFQATVVPAAWTKYVSVGDSSITVTGDMTAYRDLHLWVGDDRMVVSLHFGELLDELHRLGVGTRISEFGLAAMLTNGLIPMQHSLFEDIAVLSNGDVARIDLGPDGRFRVTWDFDYPWIESKSRGDEVADPDRMLAMLTESTERQLDEYGGSGFLMLSGGKDSPAIALALATAGRTDVPCVTYRANPQNPEPPIAAGIAARLGLTHTIVDVPTDRDTIASALTRFFEGAPLPGVDLAQIPYVVAAASVDRPSGAILDGGGNDSYMNYPTSPGSLRKQRYRFRGRLAQMTARRVVPVESGFNYLSRSRIEVMFPGRLPRYRHVQRLRPSDVNVHTYWDAVDRQTRDTPLFDVFDIVLRRHIHAGQVLLKQRLTADAFHLGTSLPWCDDELGQYCFHLPQEDRYEMETDRGKLLLRKMLLKHLDYDADVVGKHYFLFDGAEFIGRHIEFVRAEIDASPLWDPDGLEMVHGWLQDLEKRPMLHHAILTVFMISGWSNHSRHAVRALGASG